MSETIKNAINEINRYGILSFLVFGVYLVFRIIISSKGQWPGREKYYYEILMNLGIWKNSLNDRLNYYQQPGSEYYDYSNNAFFQKQSQIAGQATGIIRDQLNVARLFLSKSSVLAIEELISEHWVISEHKAINNNDYLELTYAEVKKAYDLILADASRDLKKTRFLELIKNVVPK
jgi:hypothetical protein